MTKRGTTGRGRPSAMPDADYMPIEGPDSRNSLSVPFNGEDGRTATFDISRLPLPGWHADLAAAWGRRIGPAGTVRTESSAKSAWGTVSRWIRLLAQVPSAPESPAALRVHHLEACLRIRATQCGAGGARRELCSVALLLSLEPLASTLDPLVVNHLAQRWPPRESVPMPGYSDAEFTRLVTAARADVATLRNRLDATGSLLEQWQANRDNMTPTQQDLASTLSAVAGTGLVADSQLGDGDILDNRRSVASQLFLTHRELTAVVTLLIALSGQNVETIKELPHHYRLIEGRAVELELGKRRRGPGNWHHVVTWEIGPKGRELHTPGGLYLLLHRLMAPARNLLPEPAFWAMWFERGREPEGCRNPFSRRLRNIDGRRAWIRRKELFTDAAGSTTVQHLPLDFRRLKTSVDVRRTRAVGGHLPSSTRTNTIPVLFQNYLRGDPTVIDWAEDVVSEAMTDIEHAAWSAHRHLMNGAERELRVHTGEDRDLAEMSAASGTVEAAWSTCLDPHQPGTQSPCRASFLDCFHCGNCVVTPDHLPRIVALLDILEHRRKLLGEDRWWERYGPTWAAIRFDVLAKFAPGAVRAARAQSTPDELLELVEPRWVQP